MDYETSKVVHHVEEPKQSIENIVISPDGRIIAFQFSSVSRL